MTIDTEPDLRRATDREIRIARDWAREYTADWGDGEEEQKGREFEYESALEIIIFANGGRTSQPRPPVVVLCGSTRFYDEFQRANYDLTMAGNIVLSVGFYPHSPQVHGEGVGCTPEQKAELDELHKRKIDMADECLVLNVGGYIGESTRSEIAYAEARGVPVRYLEPIGAGE